MKSLIPNVTFYSHDDELEKMTQDMGHIKRKLLAGEEKSITAVAYARDSKLQAKRQILGAKRSLPTLPELDHVPLSERKHSRIISVADSPNVLHVKRKGFSAKIMERCEWNKITPF